MEYDYGRCHQCGGLMEERGTEQSVQEGDEWILIRNVPTGVCTRCGEQTFRWDVMERLDEIVRQRRQNTPAARLELPVFAF